LSAQRPTGVSELSRDLAKRQWSPAQQSSWLTEEFYKTKIEPVLTKASLSQIASAIQVSIPYASDIRKGRRRPHPRLWLALAELVGLKDQG